MKTELYSKSKFKDVVQFLNPPKDVDLDYLYDIYEAVIDGADGLISATPSQKFLPINSFVVVLYLLNEFFFMYSQLSKKDQENYQDNDIFAQSLASIVCDKYLTNEQLNYKSFSYLNKYNPQISTINLYLNFILKNLESIEIGDDSAALVKQMLFKGFSLCKTITEMLIIGSENEAFSTWRTLHENECILTCLVNYGKPMFEEYYKHITYSLAYRHQFDKVKEDVIFAQIKKEMAEHELKSKDMKKFIEYGYLYVIKDFDEKGYKLNFRDGVQKAANLSEYSTVYEMSSEIAHSSPIFLLSQKDHITNLTILNLYETFFRLEKIFDRIVKGIKKNVNDDSYESMRNVYLNQMIAIYKDEQKKFLGNK